MAIEFARLEYVSRSNGGNSCRKGSYNGRQKIRCEREGTTYDFSREGDNAHHEILLPKSADPKFKNVEVLWNAIEFSETRKNSQLAKEMVLALPDDPQISFEDKGELTKSFIQKHFIDKGVAAQVDIHSPHKEKDHNWHAHILITTRRFTKDGSSFGEKARDLDGQVRKGRVVEAEHWGKLWKCHQNEYFEEKGIEIRVDPIGIVPQEHLGPVRMRARAFALLNEHVRRQEHNAALAVDPAQILSKLTEKQSLFSKDEVESFIHKHVPTEAIAETQAAFWKQADILQLIDSNSGERLEKFTSKAVRDEENRIIRLSDRLSHNKAITVRLNTQEKVLSNFSLNGEQSNAYKAIFTGKRLMCIEGRAGTGKSHLLSAIRETYEIAGYRVRGFAPTSEVAKDLEKQGFSDAENLHRFLFAHSHQSRNIAGKEIWIVDEAGMVGNQPLQELLGKAWKNGCQLILVGDSRQLPPVERGGMFEIFCQKYGSEKLEQIQRQEKEHHREIAALASRGKIGEAIDQLIQNKALHWSATKQEAMESLIQKWDRDQRAFPGQTAFIMEHRNRFAKVLNEIIHRLKFERGEIGKDEFKCETFLGTAYVSEGDRIQFRANDREIGVTNGLLGSIVKAQSDEFVVRTDQEKEIMFNPKEFHRYQLGYAGTYHRAQGKTVDRAYALHSPWMNRNLFYVGMTRHRKQFHYFVSREEASSLAALKFQANRASSKETTVSYQTLDELRELQNTPSVLDQTWNRLKQNLGDFFYRDKEFYKVNEKDSFHGTYEVVKLEKEKTEDTKGDSSASVGRFAAIKPIENKSFHKSSAQDLLYRYLAVAEDIRLHKEVMEKEASSSGKEIRFAKGFKNWQLEIQERNLLASSILDSFDPNEKAQLITPKMLLTLQEESKKFVESQERQTNIEEGRHNQELRQKLHENVKDLCYRLFPEGPSHKSGKEWRFRSNQSLSVVITGERAGVFYDFVEGKGGGLVELIQKELGHNKKEALVWAADCLERTPRRSIEFKRELDLPKEKTWISLKPDPAQPPPLLKENTGLLKHFSETARHAYHNPEGELLYYVLRLQNREDPSKKITPPLSFGYYAGNPDKKCWQFKGFSEEKRTLYNAHLIAKNSKAPVLVVEGEKAADAATKKFPEYVVVSWPGGASSAHKANWDLLDGKKVIIWPDNDEPGFKAAKAICEALKKADAKEIRLVAPEILKNRLPEKWDLADSLPDKMTEKDLYNQIKSAEKIDRGYAGLFARLYPVEDKSRLFVEKARFFDRMQIFENVTGKICLESNGLNDPVYLAYRGFLDRQEKIEELVHGTLGLKGPILERVAELVNIFAAKNNRMPLEGETRQILDIVREVEKMFNEGSLKREDIPKDVFIQMSDYAKGKVMEKAVDITQTTGISLNKTAITTLKSDYGTQLSSIYQDYLRVQAQTITQVKANELGKEGSAPSFERIR